jgi:zinc transporter ZupT
MSFHIISLVLAGTLSIADYVTEQVFSKKLRNNQKLISFSAGVAVAYILLRLFPEISSYALIEGRQVFLYALFGFVMLNLIEQYVYKSVRKMSLEMTYHKKAHIFYFFIYNFIIGLVLVTFAAKGLTQTLLFFIPFLLYIVVEILPQEFKFKTPLLRITYSLAPIFGTLVGIYLIDLVNSIFGKLIAFITGTLLYIVIRESLPSDKAEKPFYFLTGVLFYTVIIFFSWNYF